MVYHNFGKLYKHYEGNRAVQAKVKERLEFIYTESLGVAYILAPRFAAEGYFIDVDKIDMMSKIEEFFDESESNKCAAAKLEIVKFVEEMSTLPASRRDFIFQMTAKSYWNTVGRHNYPNLNIVAQRLVTLIASSASSERSWSIHRFIHTRLRNRLTSERVMKLVYLYSNSFLIESEYLKDHFDNENLIDDCDFDSDEN